MSMIWFAYTDRHRIRNFSDIKLIFIKIITVTKEQVNGRIVNISVNLDKEVIFIREI